MSPKLIGIIGAGQLGRMLAQAGSNLNLRFRFWGNAKDTACDGLGEIIRADWQDKNALREFVKDLDLATYEFENVPEQCAQEVSRHVALYPGPQALAVSQDRLSEKTFFRELGIGTAEFCAVDSLLDLQRAAQQLGFPLVLKTRRLGYDGKGQALLHDQEELEAGFNSLQGAALIAEAFVPFERELSIIAVRSRNSDLKFYPLVQNFHHSGILRLSLAPAAAINSGMQEQAESYARAVLEKLDYVGVLAIEFFCHKGTLLANEMAPRVHNSGHWTIDGSETSQFENHLRAVLGLALGSTKSKTLSLMLNLIGTLPDPKLTAALDSAHVHLYNKSPAMGRKLGHITLSAKDAAEFQKLIPQIDALLDHASSLALRKLLSF